MRPVREGDGRWVGRGRHRTGKDVWWLNHSFRGTYIKPSKNHFSSYSVISGLPYPYKYREETKGVVGKED